MKKQKAPAKLKLHRETLKRLTIAQLGEVQGASDNSECYCPGGSDPNSCVAMCGI
jgi:hypothetical protein